MRSKIPTENEIDIKRESFYLNSGENGKKKRERDSVLFLVLSDS